VDEVIEGRCFKHGFEIAEARCRQCGLEFCNECLVYSFGPGKPPFCVPCALGAAGVRANAGQTTQVPRRELRRLEKERKKAEKLARKQGAPVGAVDPGPAAAAVAVEAVAVENVAVEADAEPAVMDEDNPFAWADAQDDGRVPF
jgi:hypothetical protein